MHSTSFASTLLAEHALAYLEDNQPERALFDIQLAETLGDPVAATRLMASPPERGVNEALALLDNRMAQIGIITTRQRYEIDLER